MAMEGAGAVAAVAAAVAAAGAATGGVVGYAHGRRGKHAAAWTMGGALTGTVAFVAGAYAFAMARRAWMMSSAVVTA